MLSIKIDHFAWNCIVVYFNRFQISQPLMILRRFLKFFCRFFFCFTDDSLICWSIHINLTKGVNLIYPCFAKSTILLIDHNLLGSVVIITPMRVGSSFPYRGSFVAFLTRLATCDVRVHECSNANSSLISDHGISDLGLFARMDANNIQTFFRAKQFNLCRVVDKLSRQPYGVCFVKNSSSNTSRV